MLSNMFINARSFWPLRSSHQIRIASRILLDGNVCRVSMSADAFIFSETSASTKNLFDKKYSLVKGSDSLFTNQTKRNQIRNSLVIANSFERMTKLKLVSRLHFLSFWIKDDVDYNPLMVPSKKRAYLSNQLWIPRCEFTMRWLDGQSRYQTIQE